MRHVAKLVLGVSMVAALAAGCSSSTATTNSTVTSAVRTACHDFGNEVIVHAGTTTPEERLALTDQIAAAGDPYLRNEANALKTAINEQNTPAQLVAAGNIARTCYNLGLLTRSGQPK